MNIRRLVHIPRCSHGVYTDSLFSHSPMHRFSSDIAAALFGDFIPKHRTKDKVLCITQIAQFQDTELFQHQRRYSLSLKSHDRSDRLYLLFAICSQTYQDYLFCQYREQVVLIPFDTHIYDDRIHPCIYFLVKAYQHLSTTINCH